MMQEAKFLSGRVPSNPFPDRLWQGPERARRTHCPEPDRPKKIPQMKEGRPALPEPFTQDLIPVDFDPYRPLVPRDILGEARPRLLAGASRTWHVDGPQGSVELVHRQFEAQVIHSPTALAVGEGDVRLTYGELNYRANQLAHHLRNLGVGRGDLVGVRLERTADLVVALLAVLKAGGAYLPLDPSYPQDRIAFMLEDARAKLLVTEEAVAQAVPPADTIIVLLDRHRDTIATQLADDLEPISMPLDLAYVISLACAASNWA